MKIANQQAGQVVFLEGEKVFFRPIEESDIPAMTVWVNDPQVRKYLTTYLPTSSTSEKKWVESITDSSKNIAFAVCDKGTGKHIGNTGLHNINWRNGSAVFGFMIGNKDFWNSGYGTEILSLMLKYAFNTLGLRKIRSSVLASNIASIRVHKKCGFKEAGVLKDEYLVDGEYMDEILFEVFKEDKIDT